MPENRYSFQTRSRSSSWIISDLQANEKPRVVRKFINSAIYVEKEITEMAPQRKTSPLSCNNELEIKTEKETFYSFNNNKNKACKYHSLDVLQPNKGQETLSSSQKTPESGYITTEQSYEQSDSSSSSGTTVKQCEIGPNQNTSSELKLSLTCLNTNRTCTLDPKEKQEIVENWMAKKELEKKRKTLQEAKMAKQKAEERQLLIEKERDNFKRWLAEKKKEEERKKMQKELEMEEEKLRQAEKEKKKVENAISFNLWLRKKRKNDLEKKISEKLALLNMFEEKEKRLEENQRAYREWLENAKHRQKPIPMNKGLQSLCSSTSVTYINPIPWNPNIDPKFKSSSQ